MRDQPGEGTPPSSPWPRETSEAVAPETPITVTLTALQINKILATLSTQPLVEVFDLYVSLKVQAGNAVKKMREEGKSDA